VVIVNELPAVPQSFFGNRSEQAYAVQAHLATLGMNPGAVDGFWGPRSQAAYDSYMRSKQAIGQTSQRVLLSSMEAIAIFGTPGIEVESQLTSIKPAYHMVLDWAPDIAVRSIRVHRKLAELLSTALHRIRAAYTDGQLDGLGLRRFAGVYNHRKVTSGTVWSKHAFGIAIDLFPAGNSYSTEWESAHFSRSEYDALHLAFEDQGFINLGKVIHKDAMHFEITRRTAMAL